MRNSFFIFMLFVGLVVFIYLIVINETFQSKLKQINFEDNLQLKVERAYNERGIYILNDEYFLNSATFIIGKNTIQIKDDAIWRPKGDKHIPRVSDINAPFLIYKNKNTDTIFIEKDEKRIVLLLSD
jgi:hypothetical protein